MHRHIVKKANDIRAESRREYYETVKDILEHPVVRKMSEFKHHYGTSCYRHCLHVSYMNFIVCRKLKLDARAAARAGMLHDLFLYDWHKYAKQTGRHFHGLTHPRYAMHMAERHFELSKKEKEIILYHMWPITITPPTSREGFVTTVTDKISGLCEAFDYFTVKLFPSRAMMNRGMNQLVNSLILTKKYLEKSNLFEK